MKYDNSMKYYISFDERTPASSLENFKKAVEWKNENESELNPIRF